MPIHVVHESHCPEIGPICAERDEPPQLHDQTFDVAELRATIDYGVARHWSVEAQVPLRLTSTRIHYRRLDGTLYEPDYENIHHRNETLFGLGDPWLAVRTARLAGPFRLSGRLGVTLPLGGTEPDPFELGDHGESHQHIQFGTGTFNPVAGIELARPFGRWTLQGYGQMILMLYENGHGFRAGHRFGIGASVDYSPVERLRLSGGADVLHEEPERWHGEVMQDGNMGRTDLLVGGGVTYGTPRLSASLQAKVPVYQHIVQNPDEHADLSYPIVLSLTVSASFGGPAPASGPPRPAGPRP